MNFWEQFALTIIMSLLQQLKFSPAQVPLFASILTHIYNDIGIILGLPPATPPVQLPPVTQAPVTVPGTPTPVTPAVSLPPTVPVAAAEIPGSPVK
jgi:hypothetical protein